MKKLFILTLTLLSLSAAAQKKPALVVGIVVDQMRYEYLYKYFDRYSDKGFKYRIEPYGDYMVNIYFSARSEYLK